MSLASKEKPNSTPTSLMKQAVSIQQNASRLGFDWHEIGPVMDKIREELDEVHAELQAELVQQDLVEEEIGDLLFAVLNLVRHTQVDPEQALARANTKFSQRFAYVEACVAQGTGNFKDYSIDALETFWQQAKQKV